MSNSQNNSPDAAGLVAETGFPSANSRTTSHGSFPIHTRRNLIKCWQTIANTTKTRTRGSGLRGRQCSFYLFVLHPCYFISRTGWARCCPGELLPSLGRRRKGPSAQVGQHPWPSPESAERCHGRLHRQAGSSLGTGVTRTHRGCRQAMELEVLRRARAWGTWSTRKEKYFPL